MPRLNKRLSTEIPTLAHAMDNLGSVIKRIADFLVNHLAIAGVAVYFFDMQTNKLHLLVESLSGHNKRMKSEVQLSEDLLLGLYKENQDNNIDIFGPILINDLSKLEFTSQVFKLTRTVGISSIQIPIKIDEDYRVYISIYAMKKNYFTQKDVEFCMLLREPLNMAISNVSYFEEKLNAHKIYELEKNDLEKISGNNCLSFIAGSSPLMKNALELVNFAASVDSTTLILGETGVGKELIANELHYQSRRKNGPFIKINCGAMPESLIDSELFGHEKGAFTGAIRTHKGCFERGNGGTVFLDEVGELSLSAQTKLLRVLQFRETVRVGGTVPIKLDIRIIAATHRDLNSMVEKGLFREDIWFRLNVFPITIPPLRKRKEDIPVLVKYIIGKKCAEMDIHITPDITPECIINMQSYDWPGNIRELENYVERSLIINQGSNIFDPLILPNSRPIYIRDEYIQTTTMTDVNEPFHTLDELNKQYIEHILQVTGGVINGPNGAAKILGLNPNTLRSRIAKLNM